MKKDFCGDVRLIELIGGYSFDKHLLQQSPFFIKSFLRFPRTLRNLSPCSRKVWKVGFSRF